MRAFSRLAAWLALLMASGLACLDTVPAGDPEPLPYWALPKLIFEEDREWWLQRTVTDAPFESVVALVGDVAHADRIRWRIEEGYLIAYRSTPIVWAEDAAAEGLNAYQAPAAIYPILAHFDVEGGQIIQPPKRPWYAQSWIRVDWANEVSGSQRFALNTVSRSGPSWTVSLPDDADAPIFTADYIDFTTHVTVSPLEAMHPATLEEGYCAKLAYTGLSDLPFFDCAPADIAFRTSIRRIPLDHEFEPLLADSKDMPPDWSWRFFRANTIRLDDQYGLVDAGRRRAVKRFNLWRESFDDAGSPIPFREREVRPILFHVSEDFPDDVLAAAVAAAEEWDAVLRDTIVDLRRWECLEESGGDEELCEAAVEVPERVLVVCPNNPVKSLDPEECGAVGTLIRLGDIRYNMLVWSDIPWPLNFHGIARHTSDVAQGETISGTVTLSARTVHRTSTLARDLVLLATGRVDPDAFALGNDLNAWAEELSALNKEPVRVPTAAVVEGAPTAGDVLVQPAPEPVGRPASRAIPAATEVAAVVGSRNGSLAAIHDTAFERLAMDQEALLVHGLRVSLDAMSDADLAAASPLRRGYREIAVARRMFEQRLDGAGDLDVPVDIDLSSVIESHGDAPPEEIFREVRSRFLRRLLLHEFGHVFGLRHNFAATFDALNFPAEYWSEKRCRQPLYRCAAADVAAESAARLHEVSGSSVMDYYRSPALAVNGLGRYDVAAIRAAYGGLAEVFEDVGIAEDPDADALVDALHRLGYAATQPLMVFPDSEAPDGYRIESVHYSRYNDVIGNVGARRFVPARLLDSADGKPPRTIGPDGRRLVPYLACIDDDVGKLPPYCSRYDIGADPYEQLVGQTQWFRANYPILSFRRGRLDFSFDDYVFGVWTQVFHPVKLWNDFYVQLQHELGVDRPELFTDPDALEPLAVASAEGFRFLVQLLATPEPGVYETVVQPDGTELMMTLPTFDSHPAPAPASGELVIPIPAGRIYATDADRGFDQPKNVGAAVDKELALEALLDPSFYTFIGSDTYGDAELWMTTFYNTHPEALIDVLGSIVVADVNRLAPRYDVGDGGVYFRDLADVASTRAGTPVDPAIGFNLRIRALIYGLGLIRGGVSDRTFLEHCRVTVVDPSAGPLPDPALYIELTHPTIGKVYRARRFPHASGIELGVSARLLERAASLSTAMESLTGADLSTAERQLQREIDLIEIMAQLAERFDEAPFGGTD